GAAPARGPRERPGARARDRRGLPARRGRRRSGRSLTEVDRQVATCIYWRGDRRVQGARRPDQESDPRRAQRPGRADAVRALLPARGQARTGLVATGDLPAPRRPGVGGPAQDQEGRPVQVPPPPHPPARDDPRAVATNPREGRHMRIYVTSVLVDDQEKALRFYTDALGFVKKTNTPAG